MVSLLIAWYTSPTAYHFFSRASGEAPGGVMGRIVYAAAMSHVLYPDYYGENVGPHGRKMVEELIDVVRDMGRTLAAAAPDALVVVADDHLNVFSFDAVPALCVRVGRSVMTRLLLRVSTTILRFSNSRSTRLNCR